MQKLRSIQFLRGVAACGVVWLHARFTAGQFGDDWSRLGGAGVDLFFVISGFIMASIAKPSVGDFLFDRFWRIMPLWWLVALPWLLFVPFSWSMFGATVTLWPIYDEFTKPALGVGWTLSFELLFYCAIALALKAGWRMCLALFSLGLLGGILTNAPIFDLVGNPIIFEFLFGLLVALLPRDEKLGLPLIILSAALFLVSPLQIYGYETAATADFAWYRPVFWGFPAAVLVYGCLCAERHFARIPIILGDASYSIYLVHLAVIQLLDMYWITEFVLSIAAGVLLWRFVEKPILRAKPARVSFGNFAYE